MADQTTPLLTLDALTDRPVVVIASRPGLYRRVVNLLRGRRQEIVRGRYGMRAQAELSALDLHRLKRQGARLSALMRLEEPTDAEAYELATLLDNLCRELLVGVPDAIHTQLTDGQRLQVVETFTKLLRTNRRTAGAASAGASPTGANSSPVSSEPTAATP